MQWCVTGRVLYAVVCYWKSEFVFLWLRIQMATETDRERFECGLVTYLIQRMTV